MDLKNIKDFLPYEVAALRTWNSDIFEMVKEVKILKTLLNEENK